jgi:hypothetical protein
MSLQLAAASYVYINYALKRRDGGHVSRCPSTPAQAVTVSSLWCDGQIPTAHRTSRGHKSCPDCHYTALRYAVRLQVRTYFYYKCSRCFRRFLRPSSGAQYYTHSIGYLSSFFCFLPLSWVGIRSRKSLTNTRCCVYSFELLMMGEGTAWKM